jgi:hypothetical protein
LIPNRSSSTTKIHKLLVSWKTGSISNKKKIVKKKQKEPKIKKEKQEVMYMVCSPVKWENSQLLLHRVVMKIK